jgi:hypothetical protein
MVGHFHFQLLIISIRKKPCRPLEKFAFIRLRNGNMVTVCAAESYILIRRKHPLPVKLPFLLRIRRGYSLQVNFIDMPP